MVLDRRHEGVDERVAALLGPLKEVQPPARALDPALEDQAVAGVVGAREAVAPPDDDDALLRRGLHELEERRETGPVQDRAADPLVVEDAGQPVAGLRAPAVDLGPLVADRVLLMIGGGSGQPDRDGVERPGYD